MPDPIRLGMTRRSFFGTIAAALAGAAVAPPVIESSYVRNTTSLAAIIGDGTVGGINRATFSFWRNHTRDLDYRPPDLIHSDELRLIYIGECKHN